MKQMKNKIACKCCGKLFVKKSNNQKYCCARCHFKICNKGPKRKVAQKKYDQSSKGKTANEKYKKSERGKATQKKAHEKYCLNNPEKRKAQSFANNNIKIPKGQMCERCNKRPATIKHHPDYSKQKWGEVIFCCKPCHPVLNKIRKGEEYIENKKLEGIFTLSTIWNKVVGGFSGFPKVIDTENKNNCIIEYFDGKKERMTSIKLNKILKKAGLLEISDKKEIKRDEDGYLIE